MLVKTRFFGLKIIDGLCDLQSARYLLKYWILLPSSSAELYQVTAFNPAAAQNPNLGFAMMINKFIHVILLRYHWRRLLLSLTVQ